MQHRWCHPARTAGFAFAALLLVPSVQTDFVRHDLGSTDDRELPLTLQPVKPTEPSNVDALNRRKLKRESWGISKTMFQTADRNVKNKAGNQTNSTKLDTDPLIVGGTPAQENPSFGFSAGTGLCGGTLIRPEYV
jgi:hypothetical protein